jgi:hypothetical protein
VFEAMLRSEGLRRSSLNGGGCVEPSIDATRTKNGICNDEEVQNEYIKFSILGTCSRQPFNGRFLTLTHSFTRSLAL